ncbi:LuxR family transcriptional regulator [Skermania sp. ID1734]|nr:LuxR family transcriptional regulator [Skermania sp. ID1734]
MPIDAAFLATADPETLMFTGIRVEEPLSLVSASFLDNEFGGGDVNRFASLARSRDHVSSLDAVTAQDRMASARYREIMRPIGLGDELRAALVTGDQCWGYLCLHRADGSLGFTSSETALIRRLGPLIAEGLRHAVLMGDGPKIPRPPAGVVVLDDALDLVATTPEGDELLSLVAGDGSARLPLPGVVFAIAAALKESERRDGAALAPRARVRGRSGHWLEIHASRLHGVEPRIAVVITPAERPSAIRIMLSAYGLSSREQEIATRVLRGESTREISDNLHISVHTVQDHLKKIFDKIGVRSRRDLVAHLLGNSG